MKKNILYIIFFMVLVACKREAVFELEGYSGQILRDRTVGLRYPTAPGRQYFLSTQADSGDYFFLTGEITPGKVTFLDFGYQHLPLYVEKQHYRVVKENDNYYILSDQKESLQNRYVQYMRRIYSLDSAYNQLCRGYDTISDIGRKALLSDRLKKDLTLRVDQINSRDPFYLIISSNLTFLKPFQIHQLQPGHLIFVQSFQPFFPIIIQGNRYYVQTHIFQFPVMLLLLVCRM